MVYTDENLFTCSQDTQDKIKEKITEHKLSRVVVASCSPKTHEAMFMETLEACGLKRYLFEMANIRNQNSWIHSKSPALATARAKDLVKMSLARAGYLNPLQAKVIPVNKQALLIGGGGGFLQSGLPEARREYGRVKYNQIMETGPVDWRNQTPRTLYQPGYKKPEKAAG